MRGVTVSAVSRRVCPVPVEVRTVLVDDDYEATPTNPRATIVHLAETADIGEAQRIGGDHIAKVSSRVAALLAKGFSRFVYVSSATVYKSNFDKPRMPTDPVAPDGIYETAKLAAENLVRKADGVIVRLGNIYGSPLKNGTVIADIISQIPGTKPVTVRNDNAARDFLWLDDAAKGLAEIALGSATGTFNLGSGIATSPAEIARIALRASGAPDRPVTTQEPRRRSEIDSIALDVTETTSQFGWRPSTTLADGISALLQEKQ